MVRLLAPEPWNDVKYRLRFSLRTAIRVWGLPGAASVALACFLVVFVLVWMLPAARHLADIEARSTAPSTIRSLPSTGTPLSAAGDLYAFHKSFPPESLILTITDQLNQAADHSGMRVTQADYRASQDLSGLARYEVSLSGRGSYPQLRRFIAACLTGFPTLSLDGLTLSRSGATDSAVDAQFRFSIYLSPN